MLEVRKKNHLKAGRYLHKEVKKLAVGEALPSIRNMISESGIGRYTLESALKQMLNKGYIEVRDRRGIFKIKEFSSRANKIVIDVICCSEAGYLDSPNNFFATLRDKLCFKATDNNCLIRMHQVKENEPLNVYEKLIVNNDIHFAFLLAPHTIEIEKIFACSHVDTVTVLPRYQVSYAHAIIDSPDMVNIQMEYLLSLGHKKIAFLGEFAPEHPNIAHIRRTLDYYRVMAENGYKVNPHWVVQFNYNDETLTQMLKKMFSSEPVPTAVISCDMALTALYNFLIYKKLRIGKDVSIISCDNLDHLRLFPEPTTVVNSREQIAVMAWDMLDNIVKNKAVPKMQYVPLSLEIRESTSKKINNNKE